MRPKLLTATGIDQDVDPGAHGFASCSDQQLVEIHIAPTERALA